MKHLLLAAALVLSSLLAHAQTVTSYELLPANATANDPLKIVLTVSYSGCRRAFGYTVSRAGNAITVRGCYPAVTVAMPCWRRDTVSLGQLPAGTYTVASPSYVSMTADQCATSNYPYSSSQVGATGTFSVGAGLATRPGSPAFSLWPTVLPASTSLLLLAAPPAVLQISVYDLLGREKARFDAARLPQQNGTLMLTLPALPPAVYLLRVLDTAGQSSVRRFVRQ